MEKSKKLKLIYRTSLTSCWRTEDVERYVRVMLHCPVTQSERVLLLNIMENMAKTRTYLTLNNETIKELNKIWRIYGWRKIHLCEK